MLMKGKKTHQDRSSDALYTQKALRYTLRSRITLCSTKFLFLEGQNHHDFPSGVIKPITFVYSILEENSAYPHFVSFLCTAGPTSSFSSDIPEEYLVEINLLEAMLHFLKGPYTT